MIRASHAIHGDRILLTLEVPAESVTASGETVSITMDDDDWRHAAKRVLAEQAAAERAVDPDTLSGRVEATLRDAVHRAVTGLADPDLLRRRAAANVLHRIADMVIGGTIRQFCADWSDKLRSVVVDVETGVGARRRARTIDIEIEIEIDLGEPAVASEPGGAP